MYTVYISGYQCIRYCKLNYFSRPNIIALCSKQQYFYNNCLEFVVIPFELIYSIESNKNIAFNFNSAFLPVAIIVIIVA